jgi:hypothetical protein
MPPPVDHWHTTLVGGWHLASDPRVQVSRSGDRVAGVAIIGHAIHLSARTSDTDKIVRRLQTSLLHSRRSFLSELEDLAGRYVVIDYGPEGTWLQTDAAALRNAYYHPDHKIIASHQNLVSEAAGGLAVSPFGRRSWRNANKSFSTPGSETHWEGVKFLNANLELNLETFRRRRVELRVPKQLKTGQAASEILDLTRSQLPFLTLNDRPWPELYEVPVNGVDLAKAMS